MMLMGPQEFTSPIESKVWHRVVTASQSLRRISDMRVQQARNFFDDFFCLTLGMTLGMTFLIVQSRSGEPANLKDVCFPPSPFYCHFLFPCSFGFD